MLLTVSAQRFEPRFHVADRLGPAGVATTLAGIRMIWASLGDITGDPLAEGETRKGRRGKPSGAF